jgi:hypothetical protein
MFPRAWTSLVASQLPDDMEVFGLGDADRLWQEDEAQILLDQAARRQGYRRGWAFALVESGQIITGKTPAAIEQLSATVQLAGDQLAHRLGNRARPASRPGQFHWIVRRNAQAARPFAKLTRILLKPTAGAMRSRALLWNWAINRGSRVPLGAAAFVSPAPSFPQLFVIRPN